MIYSVTILGVVSLHPIVGDMAKKRGDYLLSLRKSFLVVELRDFKPQAECL